MKTRVLTHPLHPHPGTDPTTPAGGVSAVAPVPTPAWVAIGFKSAAIRWAWGDLRSPTHHRFVAEYVQRKRWATTDPSWRWAGFCTSLLAYERPDGGSRKLIYQYYLDIDAEGQLERAREQAIKAYDGLVSWGLHPLPRFSGSKGFGIRVAGPEFNDLGWMTDGHLIGKQLHHLVVDELDLDAEVIDHGLWATRKLIAELNCLHPKTKLYAIPLTADELRDMSIRDIKDLAKASRREFPRPERGWSERMNRLLLDAVELHREDSKRPVHRPYKAVGERLNGPALLPARVPDDLSDLRGVLPGLTPCVHGLVAGAPVDMAGNRNRITRALARWAKGVGLDRSQATAVVRRLLSTRVMVRTPAQEAMAEVEHTVRWAFSRPGIAFSPVTCSELRGLGLDCTDQCPFHQEYQAAVGREIKRQKVTRDESYLPPAPPDYDTLASARKRIEKTVVILTEGLIGVVLLVHPAGVGKTTLALGGLVGWSKRADRVKGDPWRILYIAERHELIEQANTWYSNAFHHIRPREDGNCDRWRLAGIAAARGFAAKDVVCQGCAHFASRSCGYWLQWRTRDRHWGMTLDMATGLDLGRLGFHIVVLDEALLSHVVRFVEFDAKVAAATRDKVFPVNPWPAPDAGGFSELTLEMTEADRSWYALLAALEGYDPKADIEEQGAAVASRVAGLMAANGVADPAQALAELRGAGIRYAVDGLLQDEDELPPVEWAMTAIGALCDGLNLAASDPARAGGVPLRLSSTLLGGWTIRVGRRLHYRTGDLPLALLDATGDAELDARILGRDVEAVRSRIPLERHQVVQIADAKYAKSTLMTPEGRLNRRTWQRVLTFLRRRCPEARDEAHRPGRTLIVTYKDVALKLMSKKVLDSLGGGDKVTVTWFWGNRGKDYADHDQVIVLGYPFPREDTVVDFASVIYQGEDIDTTVITEWRNYLYGDGQTGLEVRVFRDPRLRRICEQLREAEFYQSIMRVRPLGHPWKRVVLLTQVPALPHQDIILSGLVETQELFEEARRGERLREAVAREVGRMMGKLGWVGLPWIADLCAPDRGEGGLSPEPLLDPNNRGRGDNSLPTVALVPKWPEFARTVRENGLGIPFDAEGGKRHDRLRQLVEDSLPDGLYACELSLRPKPPDIKGGRPWSSVIYADGMRGRGDILRRLVRVALTGDWAVRLDGVEVGVDELELMLADEGRPRLVASVDAGPPRVG